MAEDQTVWLLYVGIYEDRYVKGVYATAERAMAAFPKGTWSPHPSTATAEEATSWTNGLDGGDAAEVEAFTVEA